MKKQLLMALCILTSVVSYEQVRIMDNTPVQKEDIIVPYDSLSNFQLMYHGEHYDYCQLKGCIGVFVYLSLWFSSLSFALAICLWS